MPIKMKTRNIIVGVVLLMASFVSEAQVNYKIHSLFIYKFTQYIEWPDKGSGGNFVIGVVGSSPLTPELEALAATKKVDAKTIIVKKLSASADMSDCHMVFVSESQSGQLNSILGKLSGKPVLVMSEANGGAKKGAGVNFIIVDDKMKFELNKASIEKQGLKVSGELVKLAIVVG
jgi:hypothetical protein